jgi:uncharacterized membrane protein (DUF441 family)
MKIAWIILTISVLTDLLLAGGTATMTAMVEAKNTSISWSAIGVAFAGAALLALRTIQQELKAVGIKLSDLLRDAIQRSGGTNPPTPPEVKP